MSKFYLNNYKWVDFLMSVSISVGFFFLYKNLDLTLQATLAKKLFLANGSLIGAIASLLGFVFATVTILIGLGDNYNSSSYSSKLIEIIDKLQNTQKNRLSREDQKLLKNKHSASSLFFSTPAYELTLNSLLGCVIMLAAVFLLCLIVDIFGNENIYWTCFIVFYLLLAILSILRLLIIIKYLIKILTNKERSSK